MRAHPACGPGHAVCAAAMSRPLPEDMSGLPMKCATRQLEAGAPTGRLELVLSSKQ